VGLARDVRIVSGKVWTSAGGRLVRVDPATNRVHSVDARNVAGFTVAGEDVWAAAAGNQLLRLDGATGARERSLRLSSRRVFAVGDAGFPVVAWGSLWLTVPKLGRESEPQTLWRLDMRTGRVLAKLPIGVNPTPPFAAFGSLFILNAPRSRPNQLLRLRRGARRPIEVATPGNPWGLAAGAGSLWVGGRTDRVVWRLNPRSTRSTATIDLPELPRGLAFAR
jgi:sugar lactone lactonase YvrE